MQTAQEEIKTLRTQTQSNISSLQKQLEDYKIDIAVCNSGKKTVEDQLNDSKGQYSNFVQILSQNKSLNESLTACQGEKDNLNKRLLTITQDANSGALCNENLAKTRQSLNDLQGKADELTKQNNEFKVQVAIIGGLRNELEGCKQQTQTLRD